MIFPPSILRIRRSGGRKRPRNLWIPLIVIWPILVALWAAVLPLLAILALLLWVLHKRDRGKALMLGPPRLFLLLCRLRGLHVNVENPTERILIRVI